MLIFSSIQTPFFLIRFASNWALSQFFYAHCLGTRFHLIRLPKIKNNKNRKKTQKIAMIGVKFSCQRRAMKNVVFCLEPSWKLLFFDKPLFFWLIIISMQLVFFYCQPFTVKSICVFIRYTVRKIDSSIRFAQFE